MKTYCLILAIFTFSFSFLGEGKAEESTVHSPASSQRSRTPNTYNPSIHNHRPHRYIVKRFGFSVRSDFYSRYMWRGIPSSEGAVWQPSFSIEYAGFGFSAWGNFVLDNEPNQGQFNEVDLTLYYHRSFLNRKLKLRTWVYVSLYPNGNPRSLDAGNSSLEGDFRLSYELGPVEFFTHMGVRIIDAPGSIWWDMGVGYHKKLPLKFKFQTSTLFAVGDSRFNRAHIADVGTKPNLFEWSLAFPWEPIHGLYFIPSMYVSVTLAPSLRRAMDMPTNVWGGLSISYSL